MATWLDAIMSPLNAAGEGIQKLIEVRDLAKFGDALGKLYAQVLAAQQGALSAQAREATLVEEIGQLKRAMAKLENWNAEKDRYEMRQLAPNVIVYSIKEEMRGTEPPHYICAHCYTKGEKGHIQQKVHGTVQQKFECSSCHNELTIIRDRQQPTELARGAGRDHWM